MTSPSGILANALRLHQAGDFAPAARLYRSILAADPQHVDALHLLGLVLYQQGDAAQAVEWLQRAIALRPQVEFLSNLGTALAQLGRMDEAVEVHRRAIAARPGDPISHFNLANTYSRMQRRAEALASFQEAIRLDPSYVDAHFNLGVEWFALEHFDNAAARYRAALQLNPHRVDVLTNLGSTLKAVGKIEEAIACFSRALEIAPNRPDFHSNLLHAMLFLPDDDAAPLRAELAVWRERHAMPFESAGTIHPNERSADRPLRIGYVGAHFHEHCQTLFMLPLLQHHDAAQFQLFGYSNARREDAWTKRLRAGTAGWRSIAGIGDDAAAEIIRRDRIDILVDLSMHMAGNRLPLFARKPAPVQITWLACPGSTGLPAIDYRLTDSLLEDPNNDPWGCEKPLPLDGAFWCYDPLSAEPVTPLPALATGRITFGCLNQFCKVNPRTLAVWGEVLRRVPNSRLMLLSPEGAHRQEALATLGVDPQRVEFVLFRPRAEYLKLYRQIDIALDTFPYNGHTTSLDALWMGVPVVTRAGQTPVSRAGIDQLTRLGLQELAVRDDQQFIDIAAQLAGDLPGLAALRAGLRDRMEKSVLMDAPRFAREIETLYRNAWKAWIASR